MKAVAAAFKCEQSSPRPCQTSLTGLFLGLELGPVLVGVWSRLENTPKLCLGMTGIALSLAASWAEAEPDTSLALSSHPSSSSGKVLLLVDMVPIPAYIIQSVMSTSDNDNVAIPELALEEEASSSYSDEVFDGSGTISSAGSFRFRKILFFSICRKFFFLQYQTNKICQG